MEITYRLMNMNYSSSFGEQKEISNRWADISKIKREIGWEPKVFLEEGINRTISSLR